MEDRDEISQQLGQEIQRLRQKIEEVERKQQEFEDTINRSRQNSSPRLGRAQSNLQPGRAPKKTTKQKRGSTPPRPTNMPPHIKQGKSFDNIRIDLLDRGEEFVVTAELAGFQREEVEIQLIGETLRIRATPEENSQKRDNQMYIRRERHKPLARSIPLPAAIEKDDVTATLKDGVLTITLRKTDPSEPIQRIEIE